MGMSPEFSDRDFQVTGSPVEEDFTEGQTSRQGSRGTFETYEHSRGVALTGNPALRYVEDLEGLGLISPLASSSLPGCSNDRPDAGTTRRRAQRKRKQQACQTVYPCESPNCLEKFWSKKAFGDHMSKDHGVKAFPCGNCPSQYSRADALKNHVLVCKQTPASQDSKRSSSFSSTSSASTPSVSTSSSPPAKKLKGPRVSIRDLPPSSKIQPPRAAKNIQPSTPTLTESHMAPYRRSRRRDGPAPQITTIRNEITLADAHDCEARYQERIAQLQKKIEQQNQEYDELKEQKREEEKKKRDAERRCEMMEGRIFDLKMQIARSNPQSQGRTM
ncbi:hypothetical protein TWF506_008011 [Arthrobotrys conoides]|uniref:C2H2-type domain-containing protein n=1 Tax=Arthrobotrys conoides TaxID=74498 RepID=A0AAN8RTK6_9PEZI